MPTIPHEATPTVFPGCTVWRLPAALRGLLWVLSLTTMTCA